MLFAYWVITPLVNFILGVQAPVPNGETVKPNYLASLPVNAAWLQWHCSGKRQVLSWQVGSPSPRLSHPASS
jgi:hypothetical protein